MGESYETKYDTKEYVRELQDAGVVCAVNMDGYFGKDLEKMQKKQEGFEEMFFNFMQLDFSAYDDPDFCDKTKKGNRRFLYARMPGDQIMERSFAVGAG